MPVAEQSMFPANDNGEKIPVKLVDGTVIGHVNRIIIENGLGTCEIWIDDEVVMSYLREGVSGNYSIGPVNQSTLFETPIYLKDPH